MGRVGGIERGGAAIGAAHTAPAGRGGPAFVVPDLSGGPSSEAAGDVGNVALLGAMLAAQEWGDPAARDHAGRRHGRAVLDTLAELQRALLAGMAEGAGAVAQRLAELASVEPAAADPALAAVLAAIRLRARVELARLGG